MQRQDVNRLFNAFPGNKFPQDKMPSELSKNLVGLYFLNVYRHPQNVDAAAFLYLSAAEFFNDDISIKIDSKEDAYYLLNHLHNCLDTQHTPDYLLILLHSFSKIVYLLFERGIYTYKFLSPKKVFKEEEREKHLYQAGELNASALESIDDAIHFQFSYWEFLSSFPLFKAIKDTKEQAVDTLETLSLILDSNKIKLESIADLQAFANLPLEEMQTYVDLEKLADLKNCSMGRSLIVLAEVVLNFSLMHQANRGKIDFTAIDCPSFSSHLEKDHLHQMINSCIERFNHKVYSLLANYKFFVKDKIKPDYAYHLKACFKNLGINIIDPYEKKVAAIPSLKTLAASKFVFFASPNTSQATENCDIQEFINELQRINDDCYEISHLFI